MLTPKVHNKENRKIQFHPNRLHSKANTPHSMELMPVGKTLTQEQWEKFCTRYLSSRSLKKCFRTKNGNIYFLGEQGLESSVFFQEKYGDRFHFRLSCPNKLTAMRALQLALEKGLKIDELLYMDKNREIIRTHLKGT